ncbi:MAG: LPS biosynthesis protein RfbU [Candidatus Tectimicrobiota bacterium]|nr:MAG: LPS biosynthesis protein RfbU [Candidatus Tectomicrobia bacterium]
MTPPAVARAATPRVLVVSSLFPTAAEPTSGIFVREQLRQLRRYCRLVAVVSPKPRPLLKRARTAVARWHGTPVYHCTYAAVPKLSVYLNWLSYLAALRRAARRQQWAARCDVLHVHFAYPAGLAVALLGRQWRRPVVLTVRGSDLNRFPKDPILRQAIRYTLRAVAHVIAVSEDLRRKAVALGAAPANVSVIPNGVDLARFRPLPQALARQRLGLPASAQVVLYVGALEAGKGVLDLLRAFRAVCDAAPQREVRLVLIGRGAQQREVCRRLRALSLDGRAQWCPHVPHAEVPLWLGASDVLCLPSYSEGRPNVIYEAMACGRPVVASRVGGIPEMLCAPALGEMVPPGDVAALAAALQRALARQWDAATIRQYALPHSTAGYARQVVEVYRRCVATASR